MRGKVGAKRLGKKQPAYFSQTQTVSSGSKRFPAEA